MVAAATGGPKKKKRRRKHGRHTHTHGGGAQGTTGRSQETAGRTTTGDFMAALDEVSVAGGSTRFVKNEATGVTVHAATAAGLRQAAHDASLHKIKVRREAREKARKEHQAQQKAMEEARELMDMMNSGAF